MRKRPVLLLVLSDPKLSQAVADKLEAHGWEVHQEQKGRKALEYLQDHTPAAVVAPMLLADMPGATMLRETRLTQGDQIVLILLAQTRGGSLELQKDARANAVVDPSSGFDAILDGLERFHEATGVSPRKKEKKAKAPKRKKRKLGVTNFEKPRTRVAPLPTDMELKFGKLSQYDPARVVGGLMRKTMTGQLIIETEDSVRNNISLDGGAPVFASSSDPAHRFGPYLIRKGLISKDALEDAFQNAPPGKKLGEVLVEMDLLTRDQIDQCIVEHLRERLVDCFSARQGTYGFNPAEVNPPTRSRVLPKPLELLRLGVHNHYGENELTRYLPLDTILKPTIPPEALQLLARLNQPGIDLVRLNDGVLTIEQVVAKLPARLHAQQLFYALYAGGALRVVTPPR